MVVSATAFSDVVALTTIPPLCVTDVTLADTEVLGLELESAHHGVADGGQQAYAHQGDDRQQPAVGQVGLDGLQELAHGVTLAIAGAVAAAGAVAPVEDEPAAPVGDSGVAPAVRPWLAGST